MPLNPHLDFDGQCEAAFRFYEKCLGGKIEVMKTHADMPAENSVPPERLDKILPVRMTVAGGVLMGSDAPPEHDRKPQGFSVSLSFDEPEKAGRVFHALAEGGSARMPIQKTFWAARFGTLVDRFGIPWMVSCE